ncbi:Transducin beta-like protein 2 [Pseudolycoriella hygida]|uniref:Transducin beta-like protein 2 n=1 Tax=Pseudolycoriella hygida TaxID=35572 RepID=A0A9Q0MVE8_9DIPT|nr:Transducin beta-like protein 2 [Pseudolycoriella hygida]
MQEEMGLRNPLHFEIIWYLACMRVRTHWVYVQQGVHKLTQKNPACVSPYIYLVPLGLLLVAFIKKLQPWQLKNTSRQHGAVDDEDTTNRSILLWTANNIADTQQRKSLRVNVEYDHAVKIAWSPDSKAILIHKALENCVEVIKVEKKDGFLVNPTKGITFTSVHESDVIVGFGIACTGRFIMTASDKTDFVLWNLKGNILDKLDTCLANNNAVKISPCGRFIAACGFTPDVKVWEVRFSKTGEYQKTVNVFNLSGHSSGIYDLAFDQNTSHIATVSKDGTWKVFDTKIEFDLGQSARCIVTSKYNFNSAETPLIAMSLNAEVVAIWNGTSIEIFSGLDGTRDAVIDEFGVTSLKFDPLSKYLLATGDRHVRVYHNVTGYKISNVVTRSVLNGSNHSAATRERLEKLIAENEKFLANFE